MDFAVESRDLRSVKSRLLLTSCQLPMLTHPHTTDKFGEIVPCLSVKDETICWSYIGCYVGQARISTATTSRRRVHRAFPKEDADSEFCGIPPCRNQWVVTHIPQRKRFLDVYGQVNVATVLGSNLQLQCTVAEYLEDCGYTCETRSCVRHRNDSSSVELPPHWRCRFYHARNEGEQGADCGAMTPAQD